MKISKLFHWLYATLMFLPLVMFLPSCLYYSLNKYATNETTTQINYKYQSNEVNTFDDLVENNIYQVNNLYLANDDAEFTLKIYKFSNLNLHGNGISTDDFDFSNFDINKSQMLFNFNQNAMWLQINYNDSFIAYSFTSDDELEFNNLVFSVYDNLQGFKAYCNISGIPADDFKYTNYNVIESVDTNVQDTISNKMYLAWESIWNLPLFAWTKNSFVSAPFTYITGLFGFSAKNSLNYLFTYFVSISICWLVFDLIMYVPNLAHKWIDKGAIE